MSTISILLDSGAFSAWRKGISIDLGSYIQFVKRVEHLVTDYVALDCIPGRDGRRGRNPDRIEEAAAQSYTNLQTMRASGLRRTIGVFHQDEDFKWLERMLGDGAEIIALSPYAGANTYAVLRWLDDAFTMIATKGQPSIRVHGLGLTSVLLCQHHPWNSVDSSTWWMTAGTGSIPVPRGVNGSWDYSVKPTTVGLSEGRRHELSARLLQRTRRYLSEVGVDLARARYDLAERYKVCLHHLRGVEAYCAARNGPFEIIPVTETTAAPQRAALDHAQIKRRLISYYHLQQVREGALEDYVSGRVRLRRERKPPKLDWYSDAYLRFRALAILDRLDRYRRREIEAP